MRKELVLNCASTALWEGRHNFSFALFGNCILRVPHYRSVNTATVKPSQNSKSALLARHPLN